jgi:DNA-binding transcriptional ArsR family regulator
MNSSNQQLDQVFHALSDGTRRSILANVLGKEETVSEIASRYDMSMPAITKHLKVLEKAGLITRIKQGRERRCIAEPKNLQEASQWLNHYQQFWSSQLDSLKDYLENSD